MSYFDIDKRRAGTLTHISASMHPAPGESHVPSYEISAIPYVTASTAWSDTKISFPGVTQWIQVMSTSGAVSFSFIDGVAGNTSFKLPATSNSTGIMRIRAGEMWITGNGSVIAGVTNITSASLRYDVSQFSY